MKTIRYANDRGHANHGWLDSWHTFSFADYYDEAHMGFRSLRVINDDRVQPSRGFGTHPHANMEIISYVLEGALAHKDSMGNGSVIRPGDVQRMSAGTGVRHSEFNASNTDLVHFLQIWIVPNKQNITPSYEQKNFSEAERTNRFRLIASQDGQDGSIVVHQDVRLFSAIIGKGQLVQHPFQQGKDGWLHVAKGTIVLDGKTLNAGDSVAITNEKELSVTTDETAEVLLFEL